MVREFSLENEKGQRYSLMDIKNYCLLISPTGLGYSYESEYVRVGDSFIQNIRNLAQGKIGGELVFSSYLNYKNYIDFIESSNSLKLAYKIPYASNNQKEFYKDIQISDIDKTEFLPNGFLKCPVTFDCISLWYEQNERIFNITPQSNELRWDFIWDSVFTNYDSQNVIFENNGHTQAPFKVEIYGEILSPAIIILKNDIEINKIELTALTIGAQEKLIYCTKDTDMSIYIEDAEGNKSSLVDDLDLSNTNFFKIPKGACKIRLSAEETEITNAKITIYPQYKTI